jgi:hypothetical protein
MGSLVRLGFCALFCAASALAHQVPDPRDATSPTGHQQTEPPAWPQEDGKIRGRVIDQTGVNITGASVKLSQEGQAEQPEVMTDEEGQFYFFNLSPGPFQLTVSSPGLATQEFTGTLHPGESYLAPVITLALATQVTEVRVSLTPDELATEQIKEQEQQRVFGVIPNFYVSYTADAAPLRAKHKFQLAWKTTTDPVTFVAVGAVAGFAQAGDRWPGYGQGAQGYAKRFGATYADVLAGTYIGGAILPSVLKQDPRYFYKGTGTKRSRLVHALASAVICKGDNGRWQPNYSSVLGNLAAGGISNLYYPPKDRNATGVVFSTALIRMGEMAVANVFQEFLVPKLTPNLPTRTPAQP